MDNHICLVFSGNSFGFVDGGALFPVFGGDAFVPLTPYRPALLIGNYVLVPGSWPVLFSGAVKENFHEFYENGDPRFGGVFRHWECLV